MRVWTFTERQLLKEHYGPLARVPWPTARIAEALGRSLQCVRTQAMRLGLVWQPHPKPGQLRARVLACIAKGFDDLKSARRCDTSRNYVQRIRSRAGIPPTTLRGNRSIRLRLLDEVRRRVAAGETQRAVAADLGVHYDTICRWLSRAE